VIKIPCARVSGCFHNNLNVLELKRNIAEPS